MSGWCCCSEDLLAGPTGRASGSGLLLLAATNLQIGKAQGLPALSWPLPPLLSPQRLWPLVCPVVHLMSDVNCLTPGAPRICSLTIANALPLRQQRPLTCHVVRALLKLGRPPLACSWTDASPWLQELRPLVYPVVQLLSGTVRLVPTQRYFPLRLRCVRALITLSQATGVFIPTSPLLLEMLKWGELSKAPRAAGGEGGSAVGLLARQLRVSKNTLRMRGFQEEIVMQVGSKLAAAASHSYKSGLARCQLDAGTWDIHRQLLAAGRRFLLHR